MPGFKYIRSSGGTDVPRKGQLKPGVTFNSGDAVYFDNTGKLAHVTATIAAVGILVDGAVVGATELKYGLFIPALRGINQFQADLALSLASLACITNVTATSVVYAVGAGTDNDMRGGYVRCPATGERRLISANAYSGGNNTLTVTEPFARALTAGDTVEILPHGPANGAVSFQAARPQEGVSVTVAGATGGKLLCIEIAEDLNSGIYALLP
jgi:hypothetical protein